MKNNHKHSNKGSALITLIIFMVIVVIVTTAAVSVLIINSQISGKVQQSNIAQAIAESGAENAVLRLLRDPSYSGELLYIGSGTASIVVPAGTFPKDITSTGSYNNFKRIIVVNVNYDGNNRLIVNSWGEAF